MSGLSLRPYQHEALDAVEEAHARGVMRPLVVLPTGTGKTVLFADLIRRRPGRALVLVHRDELLCQAADKIRMVAPGIEVGIVKAARDEASAPVVAASVQTVSRPRRLARMLGTLAGGFNLVIVDEAHHAAADSYRYVLDGCGAFGGPWEGPLTLGVTATPERADTRHLGEVWEEIVYRRDMLGMIRAGYLADLRGVRVRLDVDLDGVRTRQGDWVPSELDRMLRDADAPRHTVAAFLEHAADRKAIAFAPTVAVAHALAEAFCGSGVPAEALDGTTDSELRSAILRRLRSGETQVVANCAVLTEGFDEPSVGCIIIARPTQSRPLYVQMIGRGTRPHPGKSDCIILDLVGASSRHDLMTLPTVFGLPPDAAELTPVSEAVRDASSKDDLGADQGERVLTGASAVFEEEPGRIVSEVVDLFARRSTAWIPSRDGFVLQAGGGIVVLRPDGEGWRVTLVDRTGAAHEVAAGLDLGYAQGRGEDLVRERGGEALVTRDARWRARAASDRQLAGLARWGIHPEGQITAGEASDRMTAAIAERAMRRQREVAAGAR